MPPKMPTADQCSNRVDVHWTDGEGFAIWYPQMGGYIAMAVVELHGKQSTADDESCFDVWVWHDGVFPFGENDGNPRRLHHCMAKQFIQFGTEVERKITAARQQRETDVHVLRVKL